MNEPLAFSQALHDTTSGRKAIPVYIYAGSLTQIQLYAIDVIYASLNHSGMFLTPL